jgi:hypothetical protein
MSMVFILGMALTAGVYVGFYELSRRNRLVSLILQGVMLLAVPFMIANVESAFRILKIISVLIPISLLAACRYAAEKPGKLPTFFEKNWILYLAYGILLLNIAEAVITDLATAHYANATAGIILMITLPYRPSTWSIQKTGHFDFLFNTPVLWTILYTMWNATFVYGENPAYAMHSLIILIIPAIYAIAYADGKIWYQVRAYTLALTLFIKHTFDFLTPLIDTSASYSLPLHYLFGAITVTFALCFLLHAISTYLLFPTYHETKTEAVE